MSSIQDQIEMVRNLRDLLCKNKNASMDEVTAVLTMPGVQFDPEVTFGAIPENLPVCLAARAQRSDILKLLVETYHADVNFSFCMTLVPAANSMDLIPVSEVTSVNFQDFLILACCDNYDVCRRMLGIVTKTPDSRISDSTKSLLLFMSLASINRLDIRILQILLRNLRHLPVDKDGRTSLHHIAMRCGRTTGPHTPIIEVLQELAKVGRSVNAFDDYGLTALQYASRAGCLAAVRVLIAAGADVNKYWERDSCTALHLAVAAQSVDVVHELLRAGAKTKTEVLCDYVAEDRMSINGDPADVARAAGNFRLARYVADPLRSSLGVLLDSNPAAEGESAAAAVLFEPLPGDEIDGTCSICMEDTKLIPLGRCHHAFCKSCLTSWFRTSSNGVARPQCPHSGCNVPVSIYDIRVVLGPSEADRVDQLLLQRSLAEMPDFRWCPRCSGGGFFQGVCHSAVCLSCGYRFCTECQQEAHDGMTCQEKCALIVGDKVGTAHWMSVNTKPCPACHVPICKNGGCSHMHCTRCGYEFCWFCLGKYQGVYTFDQRCPCPKRPTR